MKRVCAIILFLVLLFCGCDPASYHFDANDIINQAVKIQLVECENDNPVNVNVGKNTVLQIDLNHSRVVGTLEQEKIDEFVNDLSTITFHLEKESVNAPIGYTLLIYLKNQEILVLSCTVIDGTAFGMAAAFSSDGKFVRHIASFADGPRFRRLLADYFDV